MCIRDRIERVPVEDEDIRNVYKYFSLQRHGALIRSELEWDEYWRWESDDIMAAVYYNTEQKPLGYVIYYIRDEVLRIKEIVYLTQEAKYGIWNYISAHFSMVNQVEGANYSGQPIDVYKRQMEGFMQILPRLRVWISAGQM